MQPRSVFILAAPHAGSAALVKALRGALRPSDQTIAQVRAVVPEARFVYFYRDPRDHIGRIIDAAPDAPRAIDRALAQWERSTRQIIEDLSLLAPESWTATTHALLRASPTDELTRLASFAGIIWDPARMRLPPEPARPHTHELAIMPRMSSIADTNARAKLICAAASELPLASARRSA